MAMTRQAPTVCSAATVQALSSVKNITFSSVVLRPMLRAWLSSKKVTIRSFHLKTMTSERDGGDDRDLHHVLVGDRQDVAEHDGLDR